MCNWIGVYRPADRCLVGKQWVSSGRMDVSAHVVETINQGKIHIIEPDLDAYVRSGVAAGRLRAFSDAQPADVYMICVPTPFFMMTATSRSRISIMYWPLRPASRHW